MSQEKTGFSGSAADESTITAAVLEYQAQFALGFTRHIIWAAAAVALFALIVWLLQPQYPQFAWFGLDVVLILATALVYPLFYRRGQAKVGILFFLGMFVLLIAACPILIPELLLAAAPCLVLPILLSPLLLENTYGWVFASTCTLVIIADAMLTKTVASSLFPPLSATLEIAVAAFVTAVVFVALALIIRMVVLGQLQSFRQAESAMLELGKRAQVEQAQRERLEQASREIEERIDNEREQLARLQQVLQQTQESATRLAAAATEILVATTQQAAGAREQSAAISQASTTIDEVRTIAEQTAQRAQAVADLAQRTAQVSQSGQQAVADTIAGMEDVKGKAETIASSILDLSEQAQAIGQIIATVDEIADQSNMLALNAAVEAARAGEAGRGFAIVAQEVRSLAEQSRRATEQVEEILTQIQGGINTAVMAAEEGMKGADAGMRLSGAAGYTIDELADSVSASTQSATQIAAAASQQLTGMEQIAQAMENIEHVTAQSVAGAQQVERTAHELSQLAGQLGELVAQYRL
jgi:methyl-accepting chemotaxis protein